MTGLCEGFSHHHAVSGKFDKFTSGTHLSLFTCVHKNDTCMFSFALSLLSPRALLFPIYLPTQASLPPFPVYVYIFLSLSPFLSTWPPPHLPLPSRVRSRVLTLGFVQICSLQGWKVVMRAKKNSLALSLTTRLVFQMKPNENSIFYPCYSLPSILKPSLLSPVCIPPYPLLAPPHCRHISYSCLSLFNILA